MSFLNIRKASCAWVEYTQSSAQTISTNSVITWDNKKTTGSDSVSINSSTGVITLDSSRRYWIQASIHVTRPNSTSDIEFEFQTSSGTTVLPTDGGFKMIYVEDNVAPYINSSFVASLMVSYPSTTYKLLCTNVANNSTFAPQSSLFIMELE